MTTDYEVPDLDGVLTELGQAGRCLVELQASEGAAGNLSAYLAPGATVPAEFSVIEEVDLPLGVPELVAGWLIVTGSGTRMRDIETCPGSCLAILEVLPDGQRARQYSAKTRTFRRVTSEFGSHLAVHRDHVRRHGLRHHAVVHAQPRKITYLSHLPAYRDAVELNRRLLRWQPEAILNFPEGIAVVPFLVPGSGELMAVTEASLREHRMVIWAQHGVVARSSRGAMAAVDLIEYAETAASYECLDRVMGGGGEGLSPEQQRAVAEAYGVSQRLY